MRDRYAVRERIGVLSDARGLYPRLTARENIRYYGELHGLVGSGARPRAIDVLLDTLGLAPLADRRAQGFSQGEKMKVAIARALVHDPHTVLLDEPTNGLDIMSVRALREQLRGLRAAGKCLLFSSHVMQEVAALCDRIVILGAGRVVADGTAAELLAQSGAATLEGRIRGAARQRRGAGRVMMPTAPSRRTPHRGRGSTRGGMRSTRWHPERARLPRARGARLAAGCVMTAWSSRWPRAPGKEVRDALRDRRTLLVSLLTAAAGRSS